MLCQSKKALQSRSPGLMLLTLLVLTLFNTAVSVWVVWKPRHREMQLDDEPFARYSAIYSIIEQYGDNAIKKWSNKWTRIEVARAFLALPDDEIAVQVLAMSSLESGYVPWAKSPAGAVGLTQLMPKTALPYLRLLGYNPRSEADIEELLKIPRISAKAAYMHISDLQLISGNKQSAVLFSYNRDSAYVAKQTTRIKQISAVYDSLYHRKPRQ